jgi:hypothetical protein
VSKGEDGKATVEIASQALIRSWKVLQDLIREKKEIIDLRNRLNVDAKQWNEIRQQDAGKANSELWSGSKLARIVEFRKKQALPNLDRMAIEFIEAGLAESERVKKEKEEYAFLIAAQKSMEDNPSITFDSLQKTYQNYQLALEAIEAKHKEQLAAKENEIAIYRQQSIDMMEITKTLVNRPIHIEAKAMTHSSDSSQNISVGKDFNIKAINSVVNLRDISGEVSSTINQLSSPTDANQPNIKDLLNQLQTVIEAETNLDNDDKAQALEQVKRIAEAAKNPQDNAMQKMAKAAKNTLTGIITGLPTATKLVEEVNKLLPIILKIFGL